MLRTGLEMRQFLSQSQADHIGAGAQHLAQYDERGAQVGERESNAKFGGLVGDALPVLAHQPGLHPTAVQTAEPIGQIIFAHSADDFFHAPGVPFDGEERFEIHRLDLVIVCTSR